MKSVLLTCLLLIGMIGTSIGAPPDPIDTQDIVLIENTNEAFIDVAGLTYLVSDVDIDFDGFVIIANGVSVPEPVFIEETAGKERPIKRSHRFRYTPDHFY